MFTNKFTYKSLFRFLLTFTICFLLKNSLQEVCILPLPFYLSLLYLGFPLFECLLAFLLPYIISLNFYHIIPSLIIGIILTIIFSLYKKKKCKVKVELIAYAIITSTIFTFLTYQSNLQNKIVIVALLTLLTFVFISSSRVIYIKRFDYKIQSEEILCLAVFTLPIMFGVIRLFGIEFSKTIIIFTILFTSQVFGGAKATVCALVLSIAPTIYSQNINYIAICALLGLSSLVFNKTSNILSAFSLLLVELLMLLVFKLYGAYDIYSIVYSVVGVIIFLFLPTKFTQKLKNKYDNLSTKILPKYAVNRVRLSVSEKLYLVSDVFSQMQNSFTRLKHLTSTGPELLSKMADEIMIRVCEKCPKYQICKNFSSQNHIELVKIFSVGVAKNRVSLIDLTSDFVKNCGYANSVIFEMNALLGEYKAKIKQISDISEGKELICMQSEGVATILKKMALEYSKNIEYDNKLEEKISSNLRKKGLIFNELTVVGDSSSPEINVVCSPKMLKKVNITRVISEVTKIPMAITAKTNISLSLVTITIKPAPLKDASFGLASKVKDGESVSGDTHSLTKINEGSFLIALGDGMGSGLKAENTSSTAISLIESFYKAGLDSQLILSIVNKVLAINTDENFSAIDIFSINLYTMMVDFIKIGSPYSFILSDDSVKIVEGSSLPLGILDDLSPTGCQAKIKTGDTIIVFSDGISDAFTSSTDLIEFIRTLQNRNPQLICDSILKKALSLTDNIAKDDMTVIAVRIFEKPCHNPLE